MDALEILFAPHAEVRTQLKALEKALDGSMNRNAAGTEDRQAIAVAVAMLRGLLEEHMRAEETALLPALEDAVGKFGTLVNIISYDHEEIRRETAKLSDAAKALEAKGDGPHEAELREVNRHGIFLVQYLSLHMAKEESALADLARSALGEDGLRELGGRLEASG